MAAGYCCTPSTTLAMADSLVVSIIFFFMSLFIPISTLAQSDGNVAVGSTLSAGGTSSPWLSPSGEFAFGFKPLQDKDQFLLSIWYHNIPDQTVAWYPNSINPVPRGSTIRVDHLRGLVLLDPQSQVVLWYSNVSDSRTDHGFLNDTGNFILKGSDGSWLWQSFRLYADTILPSQELVVGGVLNSRRSETNFSNGRFYLRFRDDGNLALTCRSVPQNDGDGVVYYSSDTSDAVNPSNSGSRVIFDSGGCIYVMRKNNQTKQLSPASVAPASDIYYRATLEFDGVFILYSHPKNFSSTGNIPKWTTLWSLPDNICTDLIHPKGSGACGYNSICRLEEYKRPVCDCPTAYNLVDPNDKYGSCEPNFTLTCDQQSSAFDKSDLVMFEDSNVNWPDSDYEFINTATEIMCKESCRRDCFCAVAIFHDTTCWKKKLPLSNGRRDTSLNSIAFIKSSLNINAPPPYPSLPKGISKGKVRGTLIIVGSVLLGSSLFVLALIGAVCFGFYLIYRKRKPSFHSINAATMETNLRCFKFKELTEATNGFKEELGSGSFGVVYKGQLPMSSGNFSVAVKKLNTLAQEKEFRAEVNSIGKTNHKNLVHLLGFCDEGQHRLLVYEYMCKGTLASFIFSDDKPSWNIRKQMAFGIAKGLEYLHEECSVQIIHCDIKPQNILLDDYYNVRISDFGLAKLLDMNQSRASLTNVRGTKGYVAPEWFRHNQITAKVDVYSFGVLLLEIISCRKCIPQIGIGEEDWGVPLTDLAWDCFLEKRLDGFVGNDLEALKENVTLERFVMIGLWCIQENWSLRPTMRKVCQMLEGIMEVHVPPSPYLVSSTG